MGQEVWGWDQFQDIDLVILSKLPRGSQTFEFDMAKEGSDAVKIWEDNNRRG